MSGFTKAELKTMLEKWDEAEEEEKTQAPVNPKATRVVHHLIEHQVGHGKAHAEAVTTLLDEIDGRHNKAQRPTREVVVSDGTAYHVTEIWEAELEQS